jgi:glycosyltransferase involved in cell wall biosynthesis
MIPVSVVIVTRNEEKNIGDALESVKDFEDIVVVDSFSEDRTVEICKKYTYRVYQHEWQGYAKQKQMAVDYAEKPWVLILDADERVTQRLKSEIMEEIKNASFSGFYIPRKNFFLDKWIRHGGWWPDYTLRLFLKDMAFIEDRKVHEKVVVKGKVGYLKNPLEHYTYRTVSDYIKKMDRYSTLSAEELREKGVNPGLITMVVHPLSTFFKMFFLRGGFMDGIHGLILAILYSYYTFLKYLKLWESSSHK